MKALRPGASAPDSGRLRPAPGGLARDLARGAAIAAVCAALALLIALAGFGRIYYLAVFLPFFLLACLLVAWGLYLKDDGFIRSPPRPDMAAVENPGDDSESPEASAAARAAGLELSMYARRDGGLLPRRDTPGRLDRAGLADGSTPADTRGGAFGARRALLWAALFLGLLASALYSWGGVGAGYFLSVTR